MSITETEMENRQVIKNRVMDEGKPNHLITHPADSKMESEMTRKSMREHKYPEQEEESAIKTPENTRKSNRKRKKTVRISDTLFTPSPSKSSPPPATKMSAQASLKKSDAATPPPQQILGGGNPSEKHSTSTATSSLTTIRLFVNENEKTSLEKEKSKQKKVKLSIPSPEPSSPRSCSLCNKNRKKKLIKCCGCDCKAHQNCIKGLIGSNYDDWRCSSCLPAKKTVLKQILLKTSSESLNDSSRNAYSFSKSAANPAMTELTSESPMPSSMAASKDSITEKFINLNSGESLARKRTTSEGFCHDCCKFAKDPQNLLIVCDKCDVLWHLDCLPYPLVTYPSSSQGWQCPLHISQQLVSQLIQIEGWPAHLDTIPNNKHILSEHSIRLDFGLKCSRQRKVKSKDCGCSVPDEIRNIYAQMRHSNPCEK